MHSSIPAPSDERGGFCLGSLLRFSLMRNQFDIGMVDKIVCICSQARHESRAGQGCSVAAATRHETFVGRGTSSLSLSLQPDVLSYNSGSDDETAPSRIRRVAFRLGTKAELVGQGRTAAAAAAATRHETFVERGTSSLSLSLQPDVLSYNFGRDDEIDPSRIRAVVAVR
eukprot:scaffold1505_cov146-Skeletonema_marinoi.AAC.13